MVIRITGGRLRGRSILSPPESAAAIGIRPTTSLIRQSVFNQLQQQLPGCRFLDAFAGSGLMGFEALSRGAAFVLAIEKNPRQARQIWQNAQKLQLDNDDVYELLTNDTWRVFDTALQKFRPEGFKPFDVIFLDPPYGMKDPDKLLQKILDNAWLSDSGIVVLEQGKADPPCMVENIPLPYTLHCDERLYGDSRLSLFRPLRPTGL